MSVLLQLKGALVEKKQRRMDLAVRIDANVKAARDILAAVTFKPVAELDVQAAAVHINEALTLQNELKQVLAEIRTIEKELGQ